MKQTMIAVAAALAAMVGWAGESAEFRLDTMDGPRTARAVETIAYSTAWNGGGAVSVAVDGVSIKEANAPASGDVAWNAAQATLGTHTLTHTCGGETLKAVFEVVQAPMPPPTLKAETADWTYGTITLRCEDANLNGAAVPFYNLMYYDTAEAKWRVIDRYDLTIPTPVEETNSSGGKTTVTRITDKYFSKRNNGVGTVKYRVVDEADSSRVAGCETRNRHGLFVAVDLYAERPHWGLVEQPSPTHEAAVFRGAYVRYGEAVGHLETLENWDATERAITNRLEFIAKYYCMPGDIFLYYHAGHGFNGGVACYDLDGYLLARELSESFDKFPVGVGVVAIINACQSASMIDKGNTDGTVQIGWIASSQADETTKAGHFNEAICDKGWFKGMADVSDGYGFGDGDGYVTFGELAGWGQQEMARNSAYYCGRIMDYWKYNILRNIVAGKIPSSNTSDRKWKWLTRFASLFSSANGDVVAAETMPAANGCRTVGECYALGIDPEDPNDDLKITDFKMEDGKPVITLNHTKDGSGNSFESRIKTLGKANLTDEDWVDVTDKDQSAYRFFKVTVDMQ